LDVLLTTKKLKKQQLIQLSNSDFMVKLVMINIKPTNNNEDQVKKLCSSLLNEKKELINKIFAEFNYSFKYFIDGIKKLEKEVI
jgi:predicted KAP-like P-loop ATPase